MGKFQRIYSFLFLGCLTVIFSFSPAVKKKKSFSLEQSTTLSEVLSLLGEDKPEHYVATDEKLIQQGKEIIFQGKTTGPDGKKSKRVSNHFQCTNCHNTIIEDPDLTKSDPEARLDFVIAKKANLLPASTFYGVVNRTSWYNGDYKLKYGALVDPAHKQLKNAIQLCATECSQGRKMEEWEINAVLAYFYSIEFKLGDLKLSEAEILEIQNAIASEDKKAKQSAADVLRSKFYSASPASFVNPGDMAVRQYGQNGNPENGKKIFVHSCMSCHKAVGGVTNLKFDMEKVTFRTLARNLKKNNHFSVYYMVRKGTYAVPGYKPYMPNFSLERLSHQQMEDLIAFIQQEAK